MKKGIKRDGDLLGVNLSIWYTQKQFSVLRGIRLNSLSQQVKRLQDKGRETDGDICIFPVPELNDLVLVRDAENTGE